MPKITDTAGNTEVFKDLLNYQNPHNAGLLKNNPAPAETQRASGGNGGNNSTPAQKENDKKVFLSIRVSEDIKRRLDNYCNSNDMTLNASVKRAIIDLLNNGGF